MSIGAGRCGGRARRARVAMLAALLTVAAAAALGAARAQSLVPGGSWSGPYWGITAGVASADTGSVLGLGGSRGPAEAVLGGHLGYGIGIAGIYLGVEADATPGGTRRTYDIDPLWSQRLEVDWTASLRARAGITLAGALVYGTAGVAWSGETIGTYRLATRLAAETHRSTGLAIGAGVEMKLLPYVSGRIEVMSTDFSDRAAALARSRPAAASIDALPRDIGDTVVRAGLTLRLN